MGCLLMLSRLLAGTRTSQYGVSLKGIRLAKIHYLVGKRPDDVALVEAACRKSVRDIRILYVGTHIPWYLALVGDEYHPYLEGYAKNVVHINL